MAQKSANTTSDFLRWMFDSIYAFDPRAVARATRRLDRRTRWLAMMLIASVVLAAGGLMLINKGMDYIEWATRPPLADRLLAPYNLETRPVAFFDEATGIPILPAGMGTFTLLPPAPPAEVTPAVDPLTAAGDPAAAEIVPTPVPLLLDTADGTAGTCIVIAGQAGLIKVNEPERKVTSPCPIDTAPVRIETGVYQEAQGATVRVVAASYLDDVEANTAALSLLRYSRKAGHVGDYALTDLWSADYFYAYAAGKISFTWAHGPWIFSASSDSFDALEALVTAFPN